MATNLKQCNTCGKHKEFTEFSKNKARKDGLQNACKQCNKISNEKFRTINPGYMLDPATGWFAKNRKRWQDYVKKFWRSDDGLQTIYKMTNPEGMVYVGSTGYNRPQNRFIIHYYDWSSPDRRKSHSLPVLHESFDKFGFENHTIEYIEQFKGDRSEGYKRESEWIQYYKQLGISLNKNG